MWGVEQMIGLQYIRLLNNMSLEELSAKMGLSTQFLSMIEQRKKKIPKQRVEKTTQIFSMPECYFQKEIAVKEEIEILENFIKNKKESLNQ